MNVLLIFLSLKRREIIACAPTGSGKTLAFVLPILHHLKEPTKKRNSIRALVLAPTIELAKQVKETTGLESYCCCCFLYIFNPCLLKRFFITHYCV